MIFPDRKFNVVDIDIDDVPNKSDNDSMNSIIDEFSQMSYENSDLHEFYKMEQEIKGDFDDFIDDKETTDEQTESMEFIKPKIEKRPSLGDAITTYDNLQSRYPRDLSNFTYSPPNKSEQPQRSLLSPTKSKGSSKGSIASEDTVLSQEDDENRLPDLSESPVPSATPNNRTPVLSRASSNSKNNMNNVFFEKHKLKDSLEKEKAKNEEQEKHIEHLYDSINHLQSRNALAEETIDQLRLGVVLNTERTNKPLHALSTPAVLGNAKRGNIRFRNKHRNNAKDESLLSRRYSSITASTDVANYVQNGNDKNSGPIFRARSVDIEFGDGSSDGNLQFKQNESSSNRSLNRQSTGLEKLADSFQTRSEVLEQEIQNLNLNLDGLSSGSSSSLYALPNKRLSKSRQKSDVQDRLTNIQLAFKKLQDDFKDSQTYWTKMHKNEQLQPFAEFKDQIDSQLFSLSMQLDNIEHKMKERLEAEAPIEGNHMKRTQELVEHMEDLELQYDNLVARYKQLIRDEQSDRVRSPATQQEIDSLLQQLQEVAAEANGRSPNILTPNRLVDMLMTSATPTSDHEIPLQNKPLQSAANDIIDDEYGHLSSATSSFKRGKWPAKTQHQSPINSNLEEKIKDFNNAKELYQHGHYEQRMSTPPSSLPLKSAVNNVPINRGDGGGSRSMVGSTSTAGVASPWHEATSGETLPVDENGIIQMKNLPLRQSTPRSAENVYKYSTFEKSKRHSFQSPNSLRNSYDGDVSYNSKNRPHSFNMKNLEDDVRNLDRQLALAELEDQRRSKLAHSDTGGSRYTRSLLDTSPANSPEGSKPTSSGFSSNKSSGRNISYSKILPSMSKNRKRRRGKRRFSPTSLSESDVDDDSEVYYSSEDSDNDDDIINADIIDKEAGAGRGRRSKYVRNKDPKLYDKWSQTPKQFNKGSTNKLGKTEDPYQDYVNYWDGDRFLPERQGIPGKSILRPPKDYKPISRNSFRNLKNKPRKNERNYFDPVDYSARRKSWHPHIEPGALREYSMIAPHRYFVREYGNNKIPATYEDDDDDDDDDDYYEYSDNEDDDGYSGYRKFIEEKRFSRYLDEAVRAARSVKHHSQRINENYRDKYMNPFSQLPLDAYSQHYHALQRHPPYGYAGNGFYRSASNGMFRLS